jgi:AcrR family transcriptional regulator
MSAVQAPPNRRERVRAATVDEIKTVALRLLVEQGQEAMTLRAIAREMGMTAPGLYRYFPSHDDLYVALVVDTYDRLAATLAAARDAVPAGPDIVVEQLAAVARAFRTWAADHPREFGLVFASPVPALGLTEENPTHEAGNRFGAVFTEIFLRLWFERPFQVPADDELPADLAVQLRDYRRVLVEVFGPSAAEVPIGAIQLYLRSWVQLYGLVAMDVYDHLHFCLTDVEPFFEASLAGIGGMLGIEKLPPA